MSTHYEVVDVKNEEVVNFYSTKLPQALLYAKDCKRQMKSLTGKTYEILVRLEDKTKIPLKEYEKIEKEKCMS
jgi:hypothetical protein